MQTTQRDGVLRELGGISGIASLTARWLGLIFAALVVILFLMVMIMHPPAAHVTLIALYLGSSGIVSALIGVGALWLVQALHTGALWLRFAVPAILAALIVGLNVAIVAYLMFISSADTELVFAFLAFGIAVALGLSSSVASSLSQSLQRLEMGAQRIAAGDYAFRVAEDTIGGGRELQQLARWFNQMADSVQNAFERQHRAESNRRQVVAALSHDVRTPLSAIRAMIEAIDDGVVSDAPTVARYHGTIRAELRHLSVLLDDLFETSRIEAGALRLDRARFAVTDLLSDVIEASHEQAERLGVQVTGNAQGEIPAVWGDARQIYRVLTNLVHNALRYTPTGGTICLQALATTTSAGRPQVMVRIVDSGQGISAADLPHVFALAYRGEASRKREVGADNQPVAASGAGLGLAIARGIIEAHGGHIWVESPVPATMREHTMDDPGTSISFTLPTG